jgi:hypothetical protein
MPQHIAFRPLGGIGIIAALKCLKRAKDNAGCQVLVCNRDGSLKPQVTNLMHRPCDGIGDIIGANLRTNKTLGRLKP